MTVRSGTRFGGYEVVSALGAGGMGEVYRARDPKLEREVAIKVLPEAFAEDEERLARFEREAKALAALNHPNVATVHGFEADGETHFLVMELVEGEDLAERIARGPIPVDEAIPLFVQIAEGLEAAHERGIVHRDLKPANIKVGPDGRVKILDFGLAKSLEPAGAEVGADLSQSPTMTAAATMRGEVMGTAAYMSPEQAKGQAVDHRTDVWAFGACLYEALTGRRAFTGDDPTEIVASLLRDEPDLDLLPPSTPAAVRRVIGRCLTKRPRDRQHSIADVRLDLREAEGGHAVVETPRRTDSLFFRLALFDAGVLVGAVALWLGSGLLGLGDGPFHAAGSRSNTGPPTRLGLALGPDYQLLDRGGSLDISPDGRTLAFAGCERPCDSDDASAVYLRPLGQLAARRVVGTEGARNVSFSEEGDALAFVSFEGVRTVGLDGGAPTPVVGGLTGAGSAMANGTVVLGGLPGQGLRAVDLPGGEPLPLTTAGDTEFHWYPALLPERRGVLFTTVERGVGDEPRIAWAPLDGGETRALVEGFQARYVPTGHLLFARPGALWAAPFDLESLDVTGPAVSVVDDLHTTVFLGHATSYGVSGDGSLVYLRRLHGAPPEAREPVWVNRQGRQERVETLLPGSYRELALSPDGSRLAAARADGERLTLWTYDLARGTSARLTPGIDGSSPVWSPDGSRIAFYSPSDGGGVFWTAADGTGPLERLRRPGLLQSPKAFTPTGDQLLLISFSAEMAEGIRKVEVPGDGNPEVVLDSTFREWQPALSPDGRWLAYSSNESGAFEIHLRPFPDVGSSRTVVSSGGGAQPLWSHDGSELFFIGAQGMTVVSVDSEPELSVGAQRVLFDTAGYDLSAYALAPDGRFLMLANEADGRDVSSEVIVVQNWFDELERLVPTR